MEPLASWVRRDPLVGGFKWIQELSDRIALYADGVLFFFTNINRTGPRLLQIMEIFGATSGLFMNPRKSTLWTIGPQLTLGRWAATLQKTTVGLKYLGVFLSDSVDILWERNIQSV